MDAFLERSNENEIKMQQKLTHVFTIAPVAQWKKKKSKKKSRMKKQMNLNWQKRIHLKAQNDILVSLFTIQARWEREEDEFSKELVCFLDAKHDIA